MFILFLGRFFINKEALNIIKDTKELQTPLFSSKKSEVLHVLLHGVISLVSLAIGFPFSNLMPSNFFIP